MNISVVLWQWLDSKSESICEPSGLLRTLVIRTVTCLKSWHANPRHIKSGRARGHEGIKSTKWVVRHRLDPWIWTLKCQVDLFCLSVLESPAGKSRHSDSASVSLCAFRAPHGCLVSPTVPDLTLSRRLIGHTVDMTLLTSHQCWASGFCSWKKIRSSCLVYCIYTSDWYKWLRRGEHKLCITVSLLDLRTLQLQDNEPICQTWCCMCVLILTTSSGFDNWLPFILWEHN